MSDNKNALEPLADSIVGSIGLIGTVAVQAFTNIALISIKGSYELVKLVADVAGIGYRIATGTYEYEMANTIEEEVEFKSIVDVEYKVIDQEVKPLEVEYLELDESFMNNNTLPALANYKSNLKDVDYTLKCYVGVEECKKQHEIDFIKDGSLMIGGMSRWGKTSLILSIFTSLCERYNKDYLKIILVDYKRVDLPRIDCYKNVMNDCIVEPKRFNDMIMGIENECEKRAELFRELDVSNIIEYNKKSNKIMKPIIIIIDELGRVVGHPNVKKDKVQARLANILSISMGFGIYFIVASQELSKNTMGNFKANFGQSIGLKCQSKIESDQIIYNGELDEINIQGRCKHENSKGVTEFQSYYLTIEEIRNILKDKRK